MISIYACSLLIVVASLAIGRAILVALGGPRPKYLVGLSAATGLAALVVVAPLLLRLPGRATTATILVGLATLACAVVAVRDWRADPGRGSWPLGVAVVVIALALGALPFAISDHVGVLGEGIYTNDHAAQLYWADWLQHGFGPEPSAVRFGYPTGPQSVAVIAATATGSSLVSSFNGLLLAIPALTALTALGGLAALPPLRRVASAAIVGLPYLAASFLAQSAFKETTMALLVLAFALALATRSGPEDEAGAGERPSWRLVGGAGVLLALASVFTFSVPGLAWFAIAVVLWLAFEELAGRSPVDWGALGAGLAKHRVALAVGAVLLIGAAALAFSPAREFASKIADVQDSAGRLSSPVFGGEALGIWPEGDFRIVRGDVSGSLLALALGALAIAYGAYVLYRRRQLALLAMLITGAIVYAGTRAFAEIHVQAKALTVIAPLILLIGLRALLATPESGEQRAATRVRYAFGVIVLVAATLSTLLALRQAPVGFDQRQLGLERLAETAKGHTLAFLGVDRFAGYWLRETLARAPAGYVPQEISARPGKEWQQGFAADFDTLASGQLDKFQYAITTTAAYASTPPPNFEQVEEAGDYVLWTRNGPTPRSRVLPDERGNPGAVLDCDSEAPRRPGEAVVLEQPAVAAFDSWKTPPPPSDAAAGQERGWEAPGTATTKLSLPRGGHYALSLQYHSQVSLEVLNGDQVIAELPPSLEGMYLSGPGRGAFWPAGEIDAGGVAPMTITVRAADPGGLAGTLGAQQRVWLGDLTATPDIAPETISLRDACGRYLDHYTLERGGHKGAKG